VHCSERIPAKAATVRYFTGENELGEVEKRNVEKAIGTPPEQRRPTKS
jgi:hypothetical protein